MRRLIKRDEELRPVGPGPLVGHADHTALGVAERRADFVVKGAAPDRLAGFGVVGRGRGGHAGLDHKFRDEAVEGGGVVVVRGAEGEEVLWTLN